MKPIWIRCIVLLLVPALGLDSALGKAFAPLPPPLAVLSPIASRVQAEAFQLPATQFRAPLKTVIYALHAKVKTLRSLNQMRSRYVSASALSWGARAALGLAGVLWAQAVSAATHALKVVDVVQIPSAQVGDLVIESSRRVIEVLPGNNLSQIAQDLGIKAVGSLKPWQVLYEANRDVITNFNQGNPVLYPGMHLASPVQDIIRGSAVHLDRWMPTLPSPPDPRLFETSLWTSLISSPEVWVLAGVLVALMGVVAYSMWKPSVPATPNWNKPVLKLRFRLPVRHQKAIEARIPEQLQLDWDAPEVQGAAPLAQGDGSTFSLWHWGFRKLPAAKKAEVDPREESQRPEPPALPEMWHLMKEAGRLEQDIKSRRKPFPILKRELTQLKRKARTAGHLRHPLVGAKLQRLQNALHAQAGQASLWTAPEATVVPIAEKRSFPSVSLIPLEFRFVIGTVMFALVFYSIGGLEFPGWLHAHLSLPLYYTSLFAMASPLILLRTSARTKKWLGEFRGHAKRHLEENPYLDLPPAEALRRAVAQGLLEPIPFVNQSALQRQSAKRLTAEVSEPPIDRGARRVSSVSLQVERLRLSREREIPADLFEDDERSANTYKNPHWYLSPEPFPVVWSKRERPTAVAKEAARLDQSLQHELERIQDGHSKPTFEQYVHYQNRFYALSATPGAIPVSGPFSLALESLTAYRTLMAKATGISWFQLPRLTDDFNFLKQLDPRMYSPEQQNRWMQEASRRLNEVAQEQWLSVGQVDAIRQGGLPVGFMSSLIESVHWDIQTVLSVMPDLVRLHDAIDPQAASIRDVLRWEQELDDLRLRLFPLDDRYWPSVRDTMNAYLGQIEEKLALARSDLDSDRDSGKTLPAQAAPYQPTMDFVPAFSRMILEFRATRIWRSERGSARIGMITFSMLLPLLLLSSLFPSPVRALVGLLMIMAAGVGVASVRFLWRQLQARHSEESAYRATILQNPKPGYKITAPISHETALSSAA